MQIKEDEQIFFTYRINYNGLNEKIPIFWLIVVELSDFVILDEVWLETGGGNVSNTM